MEGIISNVLSITKDINLQFRTSKYPVFLKKMIAKRRRKKILAMIEKIHKLPVLDFSFLSEYIKVIYSQYTPYGRYRSCLKIEEVENGNGELAALFNFPINEENKQHGTAALSPDSKESYLIRFIWNNDMTVKFAFAEENVKFLENGKTYEAPYPYSAKIENNVIKDCFCKAILDDIYEYLLDAVKSSERVTEYDRIKIK